jgi:hypothetical protein
MPELPEVETIARGVHARLCGDCIVQVWFGSHPEPFKTPPAQQAKGLEGSVLLAVHRTGKHIVCELGAASSNRERLGKRDDPPTAQWIVHLGMTGRLLVTTPEASVAPHTHVRLTLGSGRELRFVDPRRFGRLEFRDLESSAAFGAPGAEPLTIGQEEFAALFHGRRLAIKSALGGQHLCRREPLPGRHPPAPDGWPFDQGRTGAVTDGPASGPQGRHSAGRLLSLRLCGCRRSAWILPTGASRLPANGATLPPLRDADTANSAGGTRDALLPALPGLERTSMVFRRIPVSILPDCRNGTHCESRKSLKIGNTPIGTPIAISKAPVMYRLLGNIRPAQRKADAR